jgi:hypothetical protein
MTFHRRMLVHRDVPGGWSATLTLGLLQSSPLFAPNPDADSFPVWSKLGLNL